MSAIKRINQAIEDIKQGKMVVMVDDEDRENEGDLVYAANFSSPEKVNFMATHAKGLICVAVSKKIANNLDLSPMVKNNDSSYETAFTISVDAKNAATGISASERDMTIQILANPQSQPTELVRPGHIFPLIAKEGGSLVRTGHTEGSTDLCRLAGLGEAAVICEIMKEDGTMARRPDLDIFCKEHGLNIVYISDIVEYRMMNESLVRITGESDVNFMGQDVRRFDFLDHLDKQHVAYTFGDIQSRSAVKFHNVLPHNELISTVNNYNSLMFGIDYLNNEDGALIFFNNEKNNMSQIREYGIGAQIIKKLGISEIELLTANREKQFIGIGGFGLNIVNQIAI